MPDFSKRSEDIEIMDNLNCSGEVVDQSLRELETINFLLGGNHVTIDGISKLVKKAPDNSPLHVMDLGCGSGDILKLIRKWANKKNVALTLTGVDANPNIIAFARNHTSADNNIRYETIDIFSEEFKSFQPDVVVSTLFFHHFTNDQLIDFFSQLRTQVKHGIVINDLHRHWFAYHSIKWLTKIFSRSTMVKHDGPLSVLRAFQKNELIKILESSGFTHYSIKWMWAFRWQVIIYLK